FAVGFGDAVTLGNEYVCSEPVGAMVGGFGVAAAARSGDAMAGEDGVAVGAHAAVAPARIATRIIRPGAMFGSP
ncbi:MAG: hypothetical protein ACJ771_10735, partial [Chloroflexota bacterium]